MIRHVHLIAFSGHRPENSPGRTEAELKASAPRLKRTLQALQAKAQAIGGEIHLISSLAAGADIIACETAVALNIPIHIVLAKPEAAFLETYHHVEPAKNLDHWLPRARAILASIRPDPDFPNIPINPRHTIRNGAISATSPECYAEVNTRLLESADLLLTLSNLQASKSIAGTTRLIIQATAIGVPTLNLNPADSPDAPIPAIPEAFAHPDCESLSPFTSIHQHSTCDLATTPSPFDDLAKCLILMPLLASIGASFGAVFDYGRRSTRYEEIAHGLAKTARILPTLETFPDIATAVRQIEETLQDELIEWFAAQKKGLGH